MKFMKTSLLILGSVLLCHSASAKLGGESATITCPKKEEFTWHYAGGDHYGAGRWVGVRQGWTPSLQINSYDSSHSPEVGVPTLSLYHFGQSDYSVSCIYPSGLHNIAYQASYENCSKVGNSIHCNND
jgi:hypothetical protein